MRRACLGNCRALTRPIAAIRRDVVMALLMSTKASRPCFVSEDEWPEQARGRLALELAKATLELDGFCQTCAHAVTLHDKDAPALEVLRG